MSKILIVSHNVFFDNFEEANSHSQVQFCKNYGSVDIQFYVKSDSTSIFTLSLNRTCAALSVGNQGVLLSVYDKGFYLPLADLIEMPGSL